MTGPEGYFMEEAGRLDVQLQVVPSMERPISLTADRAAYRALNRLLAPYRGTAAIVHTHSSKAGILGRWAARRAGIPVVIHSIHGFGFTPAQGALKRWSFVTAEKATSRITDHFIAVSHANRDEGIGLGLFPPERCTVIRSGFDLTQFSDGDIESLHPYEGGDVDLADDVPTVLMVGCLKPQKNPLDFVGVAELVRQKVPRTRFLLAGDGQLRDELVREIGKRGLEKELLLLGWREDVPALMKRSQVVVLPSLWEGLPRVIPQAMAAGRPMIANAVDGSAEAIRDGVDGYLCQPGDVLTMADRVCELLRDPEKAEAMGRAGQAAAAEFDQDLMVRQQEELYQKLLQKKGLLSSSAGQ
jgi:glycosyltransferase involved in cell wall biosynthesis